VDPPLADPQLLISLYAGSTLSLLFSPKSKKLQIRPLFCSEKKYLKAMIIGSYKTATNLALQNLKFLVPSLIQRGNSVFVDFLRPTFSSVL